MTPEAETDVDAVFLRDRLRGWIFALTGLAFALATSALFFSIFVVFVWPRPRHALITTLLMEHFRAVVGVPFIAVASFIVLWAFSVTQGQIEFEAGPIKFRGASGPVAFWVLSVAVLTLMVNLSW
jgi:hypothetical protein